MDRDWKCKEYKQVMGETRKRCEERATDSKPDNKPNKPDKASGLINEFLLTGLLGEVKQCYTLLKNVLHLCNLHNAKIILNYVFCGIKKKISTNSIGVALNVNHK